MEQTIASAHQSTSFLLTTFRAWKQRVSSLFFRAERLVFVPESADPVTKLINRTTLFQLLKKSKTPGSIIVIDLDHFRHINERCGYDVGDSILARIGQSLDELCSRVKRFDGITFLPAKSSGEKFIIFTEQALSTDVLWATARQVEAIFEREIATEAGPISLQVFIGISNGVSAKNATETYLHATLAMQDSREKKNAVTFFEPALYQNQIRKQDILKHLQSLHASEGFTLVFQPKVHIHSEKDEHGEYRSFEALLRWNSETLGSVSPAEFIPLAESSSLITQIDRWVIEETIRKLSWLRAKKELQISCNVSSKMLISPELPTIILNLLSQYQVPANMLQIEVTEHSLIEDLVQAILNLNAIKAMGVSIALDDFGMGHSSLALLRDLPIDTLKIDRSFLTGIHQDQKRQTLLKNIIGIGTSLELTVVIEGVETPDDVVLAQRSGAALAQGFAYTKPQPIENFFPEIVRMKK